MDITSTLLKELRIKKNITLEQLAIEINEQFNVNLTRSMLSKWETGKSRPVYDHLKRLALYYGVTTDFLLGFEQEEDMIINNMENSEADKKGLRNPKKRSIIESINNLIEDEELTNKDLLLIKDFIKLIKSRKHKNLSK
ncbi:helix-turn-helix transcriptional regulator [Clostridium sp. C2-6-12]|uniref:helix-turn-helix domain-containing protein n=1 Tax=Clostridium sp. C2-6-12 TaxID=2698832 RepID=UPI001369EA16|nr:helix-turn-helix transcriptional regulator [Clostridium sp. C2-6-12]